MSSPNDAQLRSVITNFLGLLKYTTMVKPEFGHNAARVYKAAYELGRHMHLRPDYRTLFTEVLVLEFWSDSDNECYTEPNPKEEPNWNGMPDSHYWWSKKRPQALKDKADQ